MSEDIRFLEGGTVTTPKRFLAGATYAGMKTYREDKVDLGILMSQDPCAVAGVFTSNRIKSRSLILCQETIGNGQAMAVVVNSGIANSCVGPQGTLDAQDTVNLAAQHLEVMPEDVLICSTGIIGVELPMALIRAAIPNIQLTVDGGHSLARAILTTDSHPKEVAVSVQVDGQTVTVGGIIKGSGMIHPNMATMLAFLTTDASVEQRFLSQSLNAVADETFNMATVDGDTSPNDTVLLFANGASGAPLLDADSPAGPVFQEALHQVCAHLTREMIRDAEGAQKVFSVKVDGALSQDDARKAARAVASSTLVKTAVHGSDPNWGRIVVALGRSGAHVDEEKIALYINEVCIMEEGRPIPFFKDAIIAIMQNPEISFGVHLNLGRGSATAWGCDLSEEYVTFNSAYTT